MHDEDRLKEELAKPGISDIVRRHAAELMRIKAKPEAGGELTGRSGSSLR